MRIQLRNFATFLTKVFLLENVLFTVVLNVHAQITSQIDVPPETTERLNAIYEDNEYAARSFKATWLPDGGINQKLNS
jgi:hypothetical protein